MYGNECLEFKALGLKFETCANVFFFCTFFHFHALPAEIVLQTFVHLCVEVEKFKLKRLYKIVDSNHIMENIEISPRLLLQQQKL